MARRAVSVALETLVAEQFEPVRVGFAGQQFAGTFSLSLWSLAAEETVVVEVELQQFQVA